MAEAVKVVVRVRPFNAKEEKEGHHNIMEVDEKEASIHIKDPKNGQSRSFLFDSAFSMASTQQQLYVATVPVVTSALNGFNGTVFAYGQTSSGKSWTMEGQRNSMENRGIVPNAFEHIFSEIEKLKSVTCLIRASYLEIYNEDIRDLLTNERHLEIKEHPKKGLYVKDLSSIVVRSPEEMHKVMEKGSANRSVGATAMNDVSSRSHSIFQVVIEMEENGKFRSGKLSFVDLAGSERQDKTKATGDRLKEATKINLSLTTLGIVIKHLVDNKSSHVPYRDSKLTRLLQDGLGGNSKTLMIATLSPASYNYDESLSTLRYASRAKLIKNKPKVNEDPKDALLRQYEQELVELRKKMKGNAPDKALLKQQIEDLQNQLMTSDSVVMDEAEQQRMHEMLQEQALEQQRQKERELKRQLQSKEEEQLRIKKDFSSLEEEASVLKKQLKQCHQEYKQLKLAYEDAKADADRDHSDQNEHARDLQKQHDFLVEVTSDLFPQHLMEELIDMPVEYESILGSTKSSLCPTYEDIVGVGPKKRTFVVKE